MKRRNALAAIGTGATAGLAGCSWIPFLGGCGPGKDEIGTIADRLESAGSGTTARSRLEDEFFEVKGKVTSIGPGSITIDDGTGTAELLSGMGASWSRDVGPGDCVKATVSIWTKGSTEADVQFTVIEASWSY